MKILITGGTGFIGSELIKHLANHQLTLLTRSPKKAQEHAKNKKIKYINNLNQYDNLNDIDAIINLAGEPIAGKRWRPTQKRKICASRWSITKKLVELVQASDNPPAIFISGSAVGYYGHQKDVIIDETQSVNDNSFTHQVCAKWESLARQAQSTNTRLCILRTGLVLGLTGGALPMMLPPFKFGLGSRLGDGSQYMPWIHLTDMVQGILFLLNTDNAKGNFNFSAPEPITNREFSQTLATVLNRPLFLAAPRPLINLALGEASCLLFDSIRAKPNHLLALGFTFTYTLLQPALQNLLCKTHDD